MLGVMLVGWVGVELEDEECERDMVGALPVGGVRVMGTVATAGV